MKQFVCVCVLYCMCITYGVRFVYVCGVVNMVYVLSVCMCVWCNKLVCVVCTVFVVCDKHGVCYLCVCGMFGVCCMYCVWLLL